LNVRSRKQFIRLAGTLGVTGALVYRRAGAADSYTLRLSSTSGPTTAWNVAALRLGALVDRRSNGRLKIEVYANSQLAKQGETIQGIQSGVIDLALGEASVFFEPAFPQLQVLTLPFMFKDAPTAFRVLDGPVGTELSTEFGKKGMVALGWGTAGFRQMESDSKVIRTPDDMKGLRFRIQGGAVAVGMAQALGALPVTIDITEVFTAFTQHTIDVIDSTIDAFVTNKTYSIVKHVAVTNHVLVLQPLMASKPKIESMPADLQKILKEEAKAIQPGWRTLAAQRTAEGLDLLRSQGVTVNEIDYPPFRRAMAPVYAALQARLGGDLIQRISRQTGAA
jgi:TRAP-type transport system periplasmic protein